MTLALKPAESEFGTLGAFSLLDRNVAEALDEPTCLRADFSILFELFRAELSGIQLSVSSIGLESNIPPSTVLRYLAIFEDRGWIVRNPHLTDKRISYVRLSAGMFIKLGRVFAKSN